MSVAVPGKIVEFSPGKAQGYPKSEDQKKRNNLSAETIQKYGISKCRSYSRGGMAGI